MKLTRLSRRLGWRLFLSYLVIVLVGVAVLMSTAWLLAPSSVARHAAAMQEAMGNDPALVADLYRSFMVVFWALVLGGQLMVLFWGAVIALIVWAVRAFTRTQSVQSRTGVDYEPRGSDRTLQIAQERYARGEITREQYDEIRRTLNA